jgi:carbamate kinase
MNNKTILIALGGNALLESHHKGTIEEKETATDLTAKYLLPILKNDYNLIITHGNGPQVGNLLIQNEEASSKIPPMPLDVCVAETQGEIGYILQKSIQNTLTANKIQKNILTLLTQVLVDSDDIAFDTPSKPVGPYYTKEQMVKIQSVKNWKFSEDPAGKGYRRVVPSPKPQKILQAKSILQLANDNNVVIAVGGGGIPVAYDNDNIIGIEAVIDKDLASAQLAIDLKVDEFIILTNVEYCFINFKKPDQITIKDMNLDEAITYSEQGHFSSGSMGPKVTAAIEFVSNSGNSAIITNLENLESALKGNSGTIIHQ